MNMFKKNGGFTLVELIVVIAILAILAGIAVPAYSGYIKKAEQAADIQLLSPVATAVQGLAIEKGATVTAIEVTAGGAAINVTFGTNPNSATIDKAAVVALAGELNFKTTFPGADWSVSTGKWVVKTPSAT